MWSCYIFCACLLTLAWIQSCFLSHSSMHLLIWTMESFNPPLRQIILLNILSMFLISPTSKIANQFRRGRKESKECLLLYSKLYWTTYQRHRKWIFQAFRNKVLGKENLPVSNTQKFLGWVTLPLFIIIKNNTYWFMVSQTILNAFSIP